MRWARGHECSYAGALPEPGNSPGGPWSVRWTTAEQILFHYFTRVHLRNADKDNAILSPDWRWNPLRIDWGTRYAGDNQLPVMIAGSTNSIKVQLQNTGIYKWDCSGVHPDRPIPAPNYRLRYRWFNGSSLITTGAGVSVCDLMPGASMTPTLTIQVPSGLSGTYTLQLDLYEESESFWFSAGGWLLYDVTVQIVLPPSPSPTPTSCGFDGC
jgi:hypothetical protein